jgi:hypothetical protein
LIKAFVLAALRFACLSTKPVSDSSRDVLCECHCLTVCRCASVPVCQCSVHAIFGNNEFSQTLDSLGSSIPTLKHEVESPLNIINLIVAVAHCPRPSYCAVFDDTHKVKLTCAKTFKNNYSYSRQAFWKQKNKLVVIQLIPTHIRRCKGNEERDR